MWEMRRGSLLAPPRGAVHAFQVDPFASPEWVVIAVVVGAGTGSFHSVCDSLKIDGLRMIAQVFFR